MKNILLSLLFCFFTCAATAQVGSLDTKFGNNGIQLFPTDPQETADVKNVIYAPDKSYFVVYASVNEQLRVAKYSVTGVRDLAYGVDGYSQDIPMKLSDAALQEDGKLVLAGGTVSGYHSDFHDDLMVVRLSPDGTLDNGFDEDGILTSNYTPFSYENVTSLRINDDRILVGGYSLSFVGDYANYHYDVFDLEGHPISRVHLSFVNGLSNYSPSDHQYSFALQQDKVIVSSVTTIYDAQGETTTSSIKRFNANGALDTMFGDGGILLVDNLLLQGPLVVTTQQDKVIVASNARFRNLTGFTLARFTATGEADPSFGQFIPFYPGIPLTPTAILVNNDKIYVGGNTTHPFFHRTEFALARLNDDGTLDESFSADGKQITGLSNYYLTLTSMAVIGDRLAVSGRAALVPTTPPTVKAVTALYILEEDQPVTIQCPADTTVITAPGVCTAIVNQIDPVLSPTNGQTILFALTGATENAGPGTATGQTFNRGTTSVAYTLQNDTSLKCAFTVTVLDKEAPIISRFSASKATLWPPNHKMVDIDLSYASKDNCGLTDTMLSIRSNEKNLDRNQEADWRIISNRRIQLRAEKGKNPKNRVYTIEMRVRDAAGNAIVKTLEVRVEKDKKQQLSKNDGIAEDGNGLRVQVLSNPAMDQFTIVTTSDQKDRMSFRVLDAAGRLIELKSNLAPNGQLQIGRGYRAGLYIAEFTQGEDRVMVKLIKQ